MCMSVGIWTVFLNDTATTEIYTLLRVSGGSLRLAGDLAARYRTERTPALAAWSHSLGSYALASAALAWGAAAGLGARGLPGH